MIDSLSKPFALFFHHYYSLLRFLKNNNNKTITILPIMHGIIITFLYKYLWWVTYHSQRSGINKFLSCITRMCYTVKCCSEISQCQAFSQCRQGAKNKQQKMTEREMGRACKHLFEYLSLPTMVYFGHFQKKTFPGSTSLSLFNSYAGFMQLFPTSFMRLYFKYIYM